MKELEVKDRAVRYIIQSLKEGNEVVRCSAAIALGKMGDNRAVEPLIERLLDDDPDVRHDAAYALGQLKDKRAVKPLAESIKEDGDMEVIKCAIDSLGKIKDREAVKPLIDALAFDDELYDDEFDEILDVNPQFDIQEKAAVALGELGDARAVDPLIKALNDDPVYDIFGAVLLSLGKIRDEEGLKKMDECLTDSDPLVRRRAIRAMIKSDHPDSSEKLTEALIDEDSEVKLLAMEALADLAEKGKAPVPLVLLLQDNDREVRLKAVETIGRIMGDKAVSRLFPLLGDQHSVVRARIVEILGAIGSEEAVVPLIVLLQDEKDERVLEEAITSLGKIGGKDANKCLIRHLKDKRGSDYLRKRLIYAIGSIKSEESLSAQIEVLKDREESDQNKLISVERLQNFKGYGLEYLLKAAIEEEEDRSKEIGIRSKKTEGGVEEKAEVKEEEEKKEDKEAGSSIKVWAARALKGCGSQDGEDILIALLKDDDLQVRREAAISLAFTGSEAALDVLIVEMPTAESNIDKGVLEAISHIESKKAEEVLLSFLKNKNPDVRYWTVKAFAQKEGGDEVVAGVLDLLDDENSAVKHEAVLVLGTMKHCLPVEPLVSRLFNLEERDEYLKGDIINALRQIDDRKTIDLILSRVSGSDVKDHLWPVQSLAIEALAKLYDLNYLVSSIED